MKIPPSGGGGRAGLSASGSGRGDRAAPEKGRAKGERPAAGGSGLPDGMGRRPLLSSPLVRLMGSLWKLADPGGGDGGELLDRLAGLPPAERKEALLLHLTLAGKNIRLSGDQWEELWALARDKQAGPERGGGGENLFPRQGGDEPLFAAGEEVYFRLIREGGGRGAAVISREGEEADVMMLCLNRGGRSWEFLLRRDRGKRGRMEVYTDDAEMIGRPPPSWGEFRRAMGGYGIFVEKGMKILQEDRFFSDIGSRETDHMVDIVL